MGHFPRSIIGLGPASVCLFCVPASRVRDGEAFIPGFKRAFVRNH
jgi:hypothetical protein